MTKKVEIKKIMIMILLIFFLINIISPTVKAKSIGEIMSGIEKFEDKGKSGVEGGMDSEKLQEASGTVYNILLIIGIVVAVIVGLIIAMKFMAGSVEQKAEIKQTLIPYILGCVVIFGAFGIWKLVLNILSQTE